MSDLPSTTSSSQPSPRYVTAHNNNSTSLGSLELIPSPPSSCHGDSPVQVEAR
eukprot:CAMPEP_0206612190 /NCGR_PEP_ID=MMETSP0325_2-20121206/55809_1 /ASSEMBLY_ACC=CAM_ASM_000347 /TAXON_ID=2866 /ORGANISM="Crypthecodinium cohnii, Strain Seligo" /LENGTH=52 /DNA_ID=CAMNT_0054131769 /DNA_START=68 /DNA_END=222 /DNA_ORIENTATION=-